MAFKMKYSHSAFPFKSSPAKHGLKLTDQQHDKWHSITEEGEKGPLGGPKKLGSPVKATEQTVTGKLTYDGSRTATGQLTDTGKKTSLADMPFYSAERRAEYERRGWAMDHTTHKDIKES